MAKGMEFDEKMNQAIQDCQSFEDLRATLDRAVERNGENLGVQRDEATGRFVARRDPLTPSAQTVDPAQSEAEVTKTEVIGGREFVFTGTPLEVEKAIGNVHAAVDEARTQAASQVAPRRVSQNVPTEVQDAVTSTLASRGFDVERAANEQAQADWNSSVAAFLSSEAGAGWPGGQRNLELAGQWLVAHGKTDVADKQAALAEMFADLRAKGLLFDGDLSDEAVVALTDKASPQEIIEAFKQAHGGDSDAANQSFIEDYSAGRFFNR